MVGEKSGGSPAAVPRNGVRGDRSEPTATQVKSAASVPIAGEGGFNVVVDEVLLARAKRGDRAALERLYRIFEIPVFSLARRLCRTVQDAEDVLQESLLEVFRSVRRFRGEGSFAGWVRKITVNKALMKLRKDKPFAATEPLDDDLVSHRGIADQEAALAHLDLATSLARLPDLTRAVVWLHEVEGYNHDEIGALMGKTASFSKSQLARGHQRLRIWLATAGREGPCI
jgi:RNA polymerase sigma-70 factor (ECF subfamily)